MERNDMQLTEGHTLTDHLFKLPICIAERPKPKVENEVKEDSFCHFEIGQVQDAESDQSAEKFIIETLNNNNSKDRLHLMKIEKELIIFLKSDSLQILKFPEMSSYNRMLVHKVAAYFGLDHNVDLIGNSVIVSKTWKSQTPDKRFQDLLNESKLCDDIDQMSIVNPPKRSILKRNNCESLVNKEVIPLEKSIKTLEEREEEYQQARARIFKDACQTMNMIEDTLDTNDILKAIDENLTLDERKMLTVPEFLEDKNESGVEEPDKKDNLIEINKNYESGNSPECILTSTSLSYLILPRSNSCQIVKDYSNDDLNSIDIDVQETRNFFKNEVSKKKSKKTKTKSNLLLINNDIGDHDKNPDPQKVAPLLETLTTNNTYSENVYNLHVQGVSQNFTSIPYPLITQTNNYNHFTNVINKDPKILPSKHPIIKSLPYLDNFNINLYATTMPSKVSSSFDYAGNSQLGVNNPKGDLNVVESQYHFPNRPSNLNYEPHKNLGSSILPAPSNYQPSQVETHYPFINSKFSLPSVTTYPQNQSHSVYNPLITTSQSWHTGLNNLVLQGNLAALGQSMANLQHTNNNQYPNNNNTNSNKPVPYQNVSNPINVPRVITNVPLLLNQATNISYPQNLITNIYNNQSQNLPRYNYLAATVNSAHYLQNLPQTIYSNRQNNITYPILTTVPIHNQYAPSQQQYVQVVSKPYSTNPYHNAINSQFMIGNASLQNKASVPPPLMNQLILPDTNTYNSLPKMPVPLMGQNIRYIGQPKPMKPK